MLRASPTTIATDVCCCYCALFIRIWCQKLLDRSLDDMRGRMNAAHICVGTLEVEKVVGLTGFVIIHGTSSPSGW